MDRPLYFKLWQDLSRHKRMILMSGARQTGKTTLARMIAQGFPNQTYFNWDILAQKRLLIEDPTFFEKINRQDDSDPLIVFDEIHKYRRWKNYLKGVYDEHFQRFHFLVLGSGRLNVFQKGGDSLAGRYSSLTLWPLTLAELADQRFPIKDFLGDPLRMNPPGTSDKTWEQLARLSGFPEPFLSGEETVYRRWSAAYHQQIIREDIRDLSGIKKASDLELLFSLLPSKVGAPISMDSLARDIQTSFTSVRSWLDLLEHFFLIFRLSPWSKKIARAITKERKLYLYDYAAIPTASARFENMAAVELARAVSTWNEYGLGRFALHYVRNKEKQEVDFLIVKDGIPWLLVEAKEGDDGVSSSLIKIQAILGVPAVQLVNKPGTYKTFSHRGQRILVANAARWLAGLP